MIPKDWCGYDPHTSNITPASFYSHVNHFKNLVRWNTRTRIRGLFLRPRRLCECRCNSRFDCQRVLPLPEWGPAQRPGRPRLRLFSFWSALVQVHGISEFKEDLIFQGFTESLFHSVLEKIQQAWNLFEAVKQE